jgi:hypothetical protein
MHEPPQATKTEDETWTIGTSCIGIISGEPTPIKLPAGWQLWLLRVAFLAGMAPELFLPFLL